jgi:DeoR family fructose operon transcriptional repressor
MFAEERKREILNLLNIQKKVKTLELSQLFNVSEPTVRRDINEMEEQGLLVRTHGGAIAIERSEMEPSFIDKLDRYNQEKHEIARLAAGLIKDHDTVILDSGTTTVAIAQNIKAKHVTVITNSLDVAMVLEDNLEIELILTGGQMRWNTRAMVGAIAESALGAFRVNLAFVGTNAFSEKGFTTPNLIEAQTKKKMIEIADRAFIVADSSKYGKTQLCLISELEGVSGIISDNHLPAAFIAYCEQKEIDVIVKVGEAFDRNRNT